MQVTPRETTRRRLVNLLLGDAGPVEQYVERGRNAGRSWRLIGRDLYELVGEDITAVTLRAWCSAGDEVGNVGTKRAS